jgi:hypothetical protein
MPDECTYIDQIRRGNDTRGTVSGEKFGDGGRQRILNGYGVDRNLTQQLREAPSAHECWP